MFVMGIMGNKKKSNKNNDLTLLNFSGIFGYFVGGSG
jgi:hypothetical protein